MLKLMVISDYIEGLPVVASVRYTGLMKHFKKNAEIITINDRTYGEEKSEFSKLNFKFSTSRSLYTNKLNNQIPSKKHKTEKILRNKWILLVWRSFKYSEFVFKRRNQELFKEIEYYLDNNSINVIFLTVPDIYGLYILKHIKQNNPQINAVVEVRDIINHNIGSANPAHTFKYAERIMMKYSDGIVTLSQGIFNHYKKLNPDANIVTIKNGYDDELFTECKNTSISVKDKKLVLAHVGSIYKGRNIKEFLYGLLDFHIRTGINVVFNIIGVLDNEAFSDIESVVLTEGVKVNIMGSLPHNEATKYLVQADIAVIITHKKGSEYAIPGKTFEYIGACKPILAVTEDKELVNFIQSRYGECAKHNKKDISLKIENIINTEYDFSDRTNYSRKFQAGKILGYIESIIKKQNKINLYN